MKYEYFDIFELHEDGSVSSEFPIRIEGVTMPAGFKFKPGVRFGGFDIADMRGRDIKATIHEEHGEEVFAISKFY